jgi:hypothetical protein
MSVIQRIILLIVFSISITTHHEHIIHVGWGQVWGSWSNITNIYKTDKILIENVSIVDQSTLKFIKSIKQNTTRIS